MCFGGGAPEYKKPDFGPLPSLRADEEEGVLDQTPKYSDRRTGMQARSFFTRTSMNG